MEVTIRRSTRGYAKEREIRRFLGGISPRTLLKLRKQGLPFTRLPSGTVLYSYDAVDAWLVRFEKTGDKVSEAADSMMADLKGTKSKG